MSPDQKHVSATDKGAVIRRGIRRPGPVPFTLLEVLMVLAIVTVTLCVALPNLAKLPARVRARLAAGAVREALRQASLRARTTGKTVNVVLVVDGGRSTLALDGTGAGGPSGYVADLQGLARTAHGAAMARKRGGEGSLTWELPEGVEWDDPPSTPFVFHPSGEAGGPRLAFTIAGRRYEVSVEPLTGRADVFEVDGQ